MRIALVSDEWCPINEYVYKWLTNKGHECVGFGSYASKKDEPWVEATAEAAMAIVSGNCTEGVFFCWSGTGAAIVANKVVGIRAALCADAETAGLARIWNHANVLVLSNRTLTEANADLILSKWFESYDSSIGSEGIKQITERGW